jgi:hypothetical protein
MEVGGGSSLQVEQRVEIGADPRPLAFIWNEARWEINSIGRTWEADGERHYLVMVQGDRVFELAYSNETENWRLVRRPEDFGPHRKAT